MSTILNHIIGGVSPDLPGLEGITELAAVRPPEAGQAGQAREAGTPGFVATLLDRANRGVTLALCAALVAGLLLKGGLGLVDGFRWRRDASKLAAGVGANPNVFPATGGVAGGWNASGGGTRVSTSLIPTSGLLPGDIVVHVTGAVVRPGVYHLEPGSRVDDALKAAGGPSDQGAPEAMNLAETVADGTRVYVPTRAEMAASAGGVAAGRWGAAGTGTGGWTSVAGSASAGGGAGTGAAGAAKGGKVNINSAGAEALEELPGVGPSTAARIIAYRQQYGPFRVSEDLKNVPGIGEKKYAELAPFISVK